MHRCIILHQHFSVSFCELLFSQPIIPIVLCICLFLWVISFNDIRPMTNTLRTCISVRSKIKLHYHLYNDFFERKPDKLIVCVNSEEFRLNAFVASTRSVVISVMHGMLKYYAINLWKWHCVCFISSTNCCINCSFMLCLCFLCTECLDAWD